MAKTAQHSRFHDKFLKNGPILGNILKMFENWPKWLKLIFGPFKKKYIPTALDFYSCLLTHLPHHDQTLPPTKKRSARRTPCFQRPNWDFESRQANFTFKIISFFLNPQISREEVDKAPSTPPLTQSLTLPPSSGTDSHLSNFQSSSQLGHEVMSRTRGVF